MSGAPAAIAVTGRRPGRLWAGAPAAIRAAVRELAGEYPQATWLTGGAIGTDLIAGAEVLALGRRLELVLAFEPRLQCERWAVCDRRELLRQVARAAVVEVVGGNDYDISAYYQRNRRLVERADLLVACWDSVPVGGTALTVREALRRGVPVRLIPMRSSSAGGTLGRSRVGCRMPQ